MDFLIYCIVLKIKPENSICRKKKQTFSSSNGSSFMRPKSLSSYSSIFPRTHPTNERQTSFSRHAPFPFAIFVAKTSLFTRRQQRFCVSHTQGIQDAGRKRSSDKQIFTSRSTASGKRVGGNLQGLHLRLASKLIQLR